MKDTVQRLNTEYGLNLTDEEIEIIVRQAEAGHRLFQRLYEVDTEGIVPAMKIDPAKKR
jgi:Asp-tRNA(Asn)/Glu-tRNA(Gln) amidotransferase C subunit